MLCLFFHQGHVHTYWDTSTYGSIADRSPFLYRVNWLIFECIRPPKVLSMFQNLLQSAWMLRIGDPCIGTWMDVLEQSKHLFTLSCFIPSPLRWISHSDEVVARVDFLETRISSGGIDKKSSIIF